MDIWVLKGDKVSVLHVEAGLTSDRKIAASLVGCEFS